MIYADRMDYLKASDIRKLNALSEKPEVISFVGGRPAAELFPVKEVKAAADAVLDGAGTTALQYGMTEGWTPLREQIVERMKRIHGIDTFVDDIIITAGSQQGIDYIAKMMLNPGDTVICESPSFVGAINAFRQYMPEFVGIPTDDEGMDMDELERVLRENKKVKLIYVIPNFQNPTGHTWSLSRRQRFMEIIEKNGVAVIEDNPYGDIRFRGEKLPELKSMDRKGLVMYLGTFSKILSPGMRVGWVCANEENIQKLNLIAQAAALQTSTFNTMIVSKFLDMFDIDAYIVKLISEYGRRSSCMSEAIKKYFPDEAKFTEPDGGLFTWVELPACINTKDLVSKAIEKNVAFLPGDGFFPNGRNTHCLRMNYSAEPDCRIEEGVKIVGRIIKDNL